MPTIGAGSARLSIGNLWRNLGIVCNFIQDDQTRSSRRGTLRDLHFHAAQAKLVSVLRGRILDVVVEIWRVPPTFGKYISAELSSGNGKPPFVPIRLRTALSRSTLVHYLIGQTGHDVLIIDKLTYA